MPINPFKSFLNKFQKPQSTNTVNPRIQQAILRQDLDIYSGEKYLHENPDKVIWDHSTSLKLYDEMMTDDCIGGTIELKKLIVLSVPWSIVPASEEGKDKEIAEYIYKMFNSFAFENQSPQYYSIPFDYTLNSLLDSRIYGCRCGEKRFMYDKNESIMRLMNITFMHQKYFDFGYDEYNNLDELFIGRNYGFDTVLKGVDNIYDKFIIMVSPYLKDGNYYGESDLKAVYKQYWAKKNIFNFRNIHLERWGSPLPIVTYEKGKTTPDEIETMQETLKNIQNRYYILQPGVRNGNGELKGVFDIDIREAKTSSATTGYEDSINQIDTQIKRRLLIPDKLGFSDSDGGSYALGKEHSDLFYQIIKKDHKDIEDVINPMIRQIVEYNWKVEDIPRFEFSEITEPLEEQIFNMLITNGIVNPKEKWIRPHYSIPELSEKEQKEIEESDKDEREEQDSMPDEMPEEPEEKMKLGKGFFNSRQVEKTLDSAENDFVKEYSKAYKFNMSKLMGSIERKQIIQNKDYKAMDSLRFNKSNINKLFSEYYAKLYFMGKSEALDEVLPRIPKSIKAVESAEELQSDDEWLDREWIDSYLEEYGEIGKLSKADKEFLKEVRNRAFIITGIQEEDILKDVKYILINGIDSGLPMVTIIDQIKDKGDERLKKYARTIARTNASDMYNTGRMNTFEKSPVKDFIEIYKYNAILDNRTTPFCESHHDQTISSADPEFIYIQPPNHFNCRSMLIPILYGENNIKGNPNYKWEDKLKSWGDGVSNPVAQKPDQGFGGIKKWSDINKESK